MVVDSTPPTTEATLRLSLFDGDRRMVANGRGRVLITASGATDADTASRQYAYTLDSEGTDPVPVPREIDASRLRPEQAPPRRLTSIA